MNLLSSTLSIPDELAFPHMTLPFPSPSVMFSAEREVMLSVPSEERVMTGVDRVSVDVVSGITLTDESVSVPYRIVKSGHVSLLVDVSLNVNKSNQISAVLFVMTNTPSPLTLDTLRSTAEGSDEERKSTVHPFDITIPFVSALLIFPD